MPYQKPMVTIELQEYEDLKAKAGLRHATKGIDDHKKVIVAFLNTVRNSNCADLMEKIVDAIHAEKIHLVVTGSSPYTVAHFTDILIIDKQ